jgi:hypothetical protein
MAFGMATAKITITLPDDQVDEIRALVAPGSAANVTLDAGGLIAPDRNDRRVLAPGAPSSAACGLRCRPRRSRKPFAIRPGRNGWPGWFDSPPRTSSPSTHRMQPP